MTKATISFVAGVIVLLVAGTTALIVASKAKNAQPADQHQTNQYLTDLRQFINHEYNDFEITYSKDVTVWSMIYKGSVIRTNFETWYYFLRRSPDGFIFHHGNAVAALQRSNLFTGTYGVDSQSHHYWSIGSTHLLVVDEKKLEKLHDHAGETWADLLQNDCPGVLTYGLYIKKGSIVCMATSLQHLLHAIFQFPVTKQTNHS